MSADDWHARFAPQREIVCINTDERRLTEMMCGEQLNLFEGSRSEPTPAPERPAEREQLHLFWKSRSAPTATPGLGPERQQLNLFEGSRTTSAATPSPAPEPRLDIEALSDAELIDALPKARLHQSLAVLREIARRRLTSAVPALAQHCRLHAGLQWGRVVAEQSEAVKALGIVGGREASEALARLMVQKVFEGPGLKVALEEAVRLESPLAEELVADHLRADDPEIRAAAARCVRIWPACVPLLNELRQDLHEDVRLAAVCALGRIGIRDVRPELLNALREQPSPEVVFAIAGIPDVDRDSIVLLRRAAEARHDLAGLIINVLRNMDHPLAAITAERIRPKQESPGGPAGSIS